MPKSLLCAMLLATVFLARAQDVKVETYRLDNGLTVILHEDHTLPIVAVNIWYHVGSKDEQLHRTGLAHLFEHLMFMGTKRVPKGQFDEIMERGGGTNNATTTEDRTNFFDSGPASLLPTLLWLEADRMESLGQDLDQKKLDLQREIVKNERRETIDNTPYGKAQIAIPQIMFPEGHPYHVHVIGHMADLDAASLQDVKSFFATYYVPNNASLVVAGDFGVESTKALIRQLFEPIPRGDDPIHRLAYPFAFTGIHRMTLVDKVEEPKVYMVWHSPPAYTKGDLDLDIAASILADGVSSRLYQGLVTDTDLASDVDASEDSKVLGSLFTIELTPKPGVSLDDLEHGADEIINQFLKEGPTEDELKRQVAQLEYQALSSLENLDNVADRLNEYEYFLGDPNSFAKVLNEYRLATAQDVRGAADESLDMNSRLILRVIPQGSPPKAELPDKPPSDLPSRAFKVPTPSEFKLSNGILVDYWQRPELPIMSLAVVFPHGTAMDPEKKAGLTNALSDMLEQGGEGSDAATFESDLDDLGATFDAEADRQGFVVDLTSLSSGFEKAVDLSAKALLHPRFDASDWQRIQRSEVASLEEDFADPNIVAAHVASRALYGASNPYGSPIMGTVKSVASLTVDDIKARYAHVVRPNDLRIFASGSVDESKVRDILQKAFGAWRHPEPTPDEPATPSVLSSPPPAQGTMPKEVFIVDKPGASQTVIRLVAPAPTASDPRRLELQALMTVLGGTFTSRLNHALREELGYTYDASAYYYCDRRTGSLSATTSVRADVTGPALKELLAQVGELRTGDATDAESRKAKLAMRTGFVSEMSGPDGIVGVAVATFLDGRPYESLGDDLRKMDRLDAGSINQSAKWALQLGDSIVVLVGDKGIISKQIQGLGLPTPKDMPIAP